MASLKYRDPVTGEFKKIYADEGEVKSENYIYSQVTASDTWNINHSLNKYPSVTIINTSNEQVFGDIIYINENNVQIKFSAPVSGRATLN